MSANVDTTRETEDSDESIERGNLLQLSSKEQEQFGRGRLLQMSQRKWDGREITSPVRGASVPRGILVSRTNRLASQGNKSSDDFDSESSILVSKRPNSRTSRRSRSTPRKGRGSDSSTSTSAKKTTFHSEVLNLSEGKTTHLSTLNIGLDNASIKSSSSNDISRISFQGKRALFEGVLQKREAARTSSDPNANTNWSHENTTITSDNHAEEDRNKKLEQELFRLEQTSALREEVAKRLREKIEKMEVQLEERERILKMEMSRQEQEKKQKDEIIEDLVEKLEDLKEKLSVSLTNQQDKFGPHEEGYMVDQGAGVVVCRFHAEGCQVSVPSMRDHEVHACSFRPTRCPSLTCGDRPAAARLSEHISRVHDGNMRGKDVVVRTGTNQLVSSYVNVDREPVFYNSKRISWVANELVWGGERFYMECVREPPEWFLWVWHAGSGQAGQFVATIRLFKVGEESEPGGAERSWTGDVIPLSVGREEIVARGAGFMVNDKQVRPLCGQIVDNEEQLFGYEVVVERKL